MHVSVHECAHGVEGDTDNLPQRLDTSGCPLPPTSFFLFSGARGIWKFPGPGSNLSHSSGPSHSSDKAGSLTC